MNSENLFLALGNVDDRLIEDCADFYADADMRRGRKVNNTASTGKTSDNTSQHNRSLYIKDSDNRGQDHMTSGRKKSVFTRGRIAFITSIAAILALVIFSGLCISHPAFAKDVPLVGDIFANIGYKLGFGGSYDSYATPISSDENGNPGELSSSINKTTVTLQDIYCDGKSMYISVAVESKDAFPVDQIYEIDGLKRLEVYDSKVDYSFATDSTYQSYCFDYIEGEFKDEHTFVGYIKTDLESVLRYVPDDVAQSSDQLCDSDVEWKYYELPDTFTVDVTINKLVTSIDNPEAANLSSDDIASLTYPNEYENWWIDGPWNFTFDVNVDRTNSASKTIALTGLDSGFDELTATLTPFELVLSYDHDAAMDYVVVAVDANGAYMPGETDMDTIPVQGFDTSSVTIYVCDYYDFMDNFKGQLLDNGEPSSKDCRDILESHALFSKTIAFI
ncbi:DUF4179 domain-containing protein [Butyrivibrio sp. TB]|uniref:DUF4179 domain-containing protein n=1 Tax=Butyrivibrio sp. TB TaxID=1520809 RepID=UPI0008CFF045|nr:DUF4179 domain-containing protein [Butyrivibrio sp. TB]SEQ11819.1 protein of unknown function [Butyrivibrio sp. TB]